MRLRHNIFQIRFSPTGHFVEDYLIVLKELIEKEVNKNEDIIKRSEQNIDNYLKNKHQRKY